MSQNKNIEDQFFKILGISLVVCRNKEGKFLVIREKRNRGWWLPGGKVDPPEDFFVAGVREAKEEAGIDVELKGILRIEYGLRKGTQIIKVIFYAEPIDEKQIPKSVADEQSEEAKWLTLKEMGEISNADLGWRGPELWEWANYLEQGGIVHPLSIFSPEGSAVEVEAESMDINYARNKKAGRKKNKRKYSCCAVQ